MEYSKEIKELSLMQQIYATLFSVTNKLQVQGDKYYGRLTSRQFMTMLAILHLQEDETTFNNIARKLGTSKQNVSKLIYSLEKKNYVVMMTSVRDKRAINVKITESGSRIMLESGEKGIAFMADIFNGFTEKELELLWRLLQKLYRFDDEEQDGFEEEVNYKLEVPSDVQIKTLKKFASRRNAMIKSNLER